MSLGGLAAELRREPELTSRLNPPFVLSAFDAQEASLLIVNDVLGTARLFETALPGGHAWSNRIGALVAFSGQPPRADAHAWRVLAATGWFLGATTAIEGVRQVRGASIIRASAKGGRVDVEERRHLDGLAELVRPRRRSLRRSAHEAADAALGLASDVGSAWSCPVRVDLSGGRDSRISAAAALAAGLDCEIATSDLEHGELDVVRDLLERAPGSRRHIVSPAETEPQDGLLDRVRALHLAHDGMRNPQAVLRTSIPIPHGPLEPPAISGHGGEVGHGFYYDSRAEVRAQRRGGREALLARLERSARKKHGVAGEDAYAAYLAEAAATLDEGEQLGLEGPVLLDFYYLSQRLANRSGLATRNERWSACSTPAFVRACFDLTPEQRLKNEMHRRVTAELMPTWKRVGYFEPGPSQPDTKRSRIWERPGHRDELTRLIDQDEAWGELFDAERVKGAWKDALDGRVHHHFEPVFTRIVWRAGFEDHLARLARSAAG